MKKKIIPVILILLLAVSAYYYFVVTKNNKQPDNMITLYGNVDIRQVDLGFRVPGRIKEMIFEEGDLVNPGQVIARLDKTTFNEEVERGKGELARAKANHRKMLNGSRPEEIQQAKALVEQAEITYKNALVLYNRQLGLVGSGAISAQDLDNTTSLKNESEARLNKAKEAYKLAINGFRYEDKQAAKAAVQIATATLSSAETNLKDTEIVAPNKGVILTRIHEPGAIVASGNPVYTLSLTKPVWVRTYVNEKELGQVHPAMAAKIYTDSSPDKYYAGKVGFISPVAEFTPKSVETTTLRTDLVYRIRVVIDEPDEGLRQGMPVTVKINKPLAEKSDDK